MDTIKMNEVNTLQKQVSGMPSHKEWKRRIKYILEEGNYEHIEEKVVKNQRVGISKKYNGQRAIVIVYKDDSIESDGEGVEATDG